MQMFHKRLIIIVTVVVLAVGESSCRPRSCRRRKDLALVNTRSFANLCRARSPLSRVERRPTCFALLVRRALRRPLLDDRFLPFCTFFFFTPLAFRILTMPSH